jgi:lipopolysaccharide export system permease protein
MRIPVTLSLYIGRQFLIAIAVVFGGLLLLIFLAELMELIRRTSEHTVPFGVVVEMALLRIPYITSRTLPFAVLIGAMLALARLTRSSELAVARAAGVSVWQFLAPATVLAFGLGVIFVAVINPISASMLSRFEVIEGKYITGKPSLLSVSSSGLWLRQIEDENSPVREYIIHSQRVLQTNMQLSQVIVFLFGPKDHFLGRMDADSAVLMNGYWQMQNVTYSQEGKPPYNYPSYQLPTDLTLAQIEDSFASPMTLSFWQLPGFIAVLQKAGFSALNHRIYWHSLLASPVLLVAMIFLGAVFSLRMTRRGGVAMLITGGVITGFMLHFMSDLVNALGEAGSLPVGLAAWTPSLVSLMTGAGLLLHLEDG